MIPDPLDGTQRVIVYDTPKERARVYDSAYTHDQIKRVIRRCAETHGTKANVRTMLAKDRAPEGNDGE